MEVESPPILSSELGTPKELQTPNLARLREAIGSYRKTVPNVVSRGQFDEILTPLNFKSTDFIAIDGTVNKQQIKDFINRDQGLREKEETDRQNIFYQTNGPGMDHTANPDAEAQFQKHLLELKTIAAVQRFVLNNIWTKLGQPGNEELTLIFDQLTEIKDWYQGRVADSLVVFGNNLFAQDAASAVGLPYAATGSTFADMMGKLALAAADPNLVKAYGGLISPIEQENRSLKGKKESTRYAETAAFSKPEDLVYAVAHVRQTFITEDWEALNATSDQVRRFYDIVSKQFFGDLYRGGHESWEGTAVAGIFGTLRDPRAIPGLIRHLEWYGSGHTSNSVVYDIKQILKSPLSKEELQAAINGASDLQKRIIEEWFVHPSSWVKQLDGYGMAGIIRNAEKHFALGELANVAKKLAEQKGIDIKDEVLRNFFWGSFGVWSGTEQVEKLLAENLDEIGPILVKYKMLDREHLPTLFNAMINPADQDYFRFPRMFIKEAFGFDDDVLAKVGKLYETADLKRSVLARTVLIEDALWLASRKGGKEIVQAILAASTGVSRDPERIREIFRGLHVLDSLNAFDFSPKPTLIEMAEDLRQKHIHVVTDRMGLADEEIPLLEKRMDYLIQTNVIEIIPTLLAKNASRDQVAKVIREIGRHIVLGDFQQWRNNLDTASRQLSVLPEDRRSNWLTPSEVRITMEAQSDREARKAAVEAIKRIAFEAKAHIQDVYKLDFSQQRLNQLHEIQEQLIQDIKGSESPDEKRELATRKSSVDNEARVIEGILSLELLDQEDATPQVILEIIAKTKNAMEKLKGLEQPAADLDQIEKVLTTQQKLTTVAQLRAYDSDDPVALLKAGTEPRETCQSWRNGGYNYCLPAYVVDANKRVLNVENQQGEVLARSVAKLTHIRTEGGQTVPAILLEPVYTTSETSYIYRAIARLALAKAQATGAVLVLTREMIAASHADQSKTIEVLPQEAKRAGFKVDRKSVEVFIPQSHNAFEYTDTLGGAINFFERYQPLQNAIVVSKL